jgi:hypothetical protein
MELGIVLLFIFIVWTNEKLFGKSFFTPVPPKTPEEEFTTALKKFLEKGIPVRNVDSKKD